MSNTMSSRKSYTKGRTVVFITTDSDGQTWITRGIVKRTIGERAAKNQAAKLVAQGYNEATVW